MSEAPASIINLLSPKSLMEEPQSESVPDQTGARTTDGNETESQTSRQRHVFVVDLTSRTPPYDRRLCEALREAGAHVELWAAGSGRSELLDDIDVPLRRGWTDLATQIPVTERTGPFVKVLKAVEYVINLAALLVASERERPDLLHFQWFPLLDLVSVEGALVKFFQMRGIQVVYTAHDVVPLDEREALRTYQRLYRTVDAVVCHTKQARHRLVEEFHVDAQDIRVIPHGPLMDREAFPACREARERLGWAQEQPTALLFGVLRPYKGVEFLLKSWAEVHERVPRARLIVAGHAAPSYAQKLRGLLRDPRVEDSVELRFRFLPEQELQTLIAAADLLVYPYRNITQSGALFAGMNAGKPIVATRVGGLKEVLRDEQTGVLVDYGDQTQLAERLGRLLQDPERQETLGQAAQHEIDTSYSWERIAQKTIHCYEGL